MAIAITLCRFNDLGRSVTPFFLRWVIFSTDFVYVLQKNEENLSSRSLNFFAKRSIEFCSFDLFFLLCGSFKCLFKD